MAGSVEDSGFGTASTKPLVDLPAAERLPILAVDDRPDNLVALRAVLAPLALEVVTAGSGKEALRLLLERDFALILLDVRMADLDGIETARLIKAREHTREVPIVFLTAARDEVSDMLRGYDVGAVDYVLKPFDEELLRSKVAVFAELEHRRLALRQSELFLRAAFENAPIGKTLLDADRRIARANPAFARALRYEQGALTGMPISELCDPDDRSALGAVLDEVTSRSGAHIAESGLGRDVRLITSMGREIWVAPTASWIKGSEAQTPHLLVQWVDVGARRRSEQARAELLVEQAARAHAEAQAERLGKLQRLLDTLESRSLDDLLTEVARHLVDMFDADAAETQVYDGGDGEALVRATGSHIRRPDAALSDHHGLWHECVLLAEAKTIGLLRVALAPGRSFSPVERALLEDAANHVSLLVRRMQLHEREHRIAVELQRGLLPARVPELPGVEIAAHYQPAGLVTQVGGDWYDAFQLADGRLGFVIGDVTGSGIQAASAMGQLRSVTRAFALGDPEPPSPGEVLTRVHGYHQAIGFEQLFTVLYLILDTSNGTVCWANAGHPPPLLRSAGGDVRSLDGSQPLMSIAHVVYEDRNASVGDGDLVVLYTDGLIERRGMTAESAVGRLHAALREGPQEPAALCAHLLESVPPRADEYEDDVTAVVVRVTPRAGGSDAHPGSGESRVQVTLTPDVHAPAVARRVLETSFGLQLDEEALARAKLAVSELTTNAVLHGEGEIMLVADLTDSRLLVEVVDQGSGFEYAVRQQPFDAIHGRGLHIVDSETSRWGMHEGTTHVWFEIERRGPRVGTQRR
jgi:PAS domain S-box-containing protein